MVLTTYHLIKSERKSTPISIALLMVFPAVGLGKWIYAQTILRDENPVFSEKWYMWKYMIKVNWGYFGLIAFLPLLFLLLMFFGVAVGELVNFGSSNMDAFSDIDAMLEVGIAMLLLFACITLTFLLIIPYLVLIHLPKTQMRALERQHFLAQQMAGSQSPSKPTRPISLLTDIHVYALSCIQEFNAIPSNRKKQLEKVAFYVKSKFTKGESVNLTFIGAENSRVSQLTQIWAAVAAGFYGIKNVQTYSGGMEETAFNKRAVAAIKRAGFLVDGTLGTNPRYSIRFSEETGSLDCYSKKLDTSANPQKGFIAILISSKADEKQPLLLESEFRINLFYDTPKIADRTEAEIATYDNHCKQIATEMLYLFSKV